MGTELLLVASRREAIGRSAYLHPTDDCRQKFASRKGPIRSLGKSIDRDVRRAFVQNLPKAREFSPGSDELG